VGLLQLPPGEEGYKGCNPTGGVGSGFGDLLNATQF